MKRFILAFLIAPTLSLYAAPSANPADFPLKARVVYSANRSEILDGPKRLDAIIDGQTIELTSFTASPGVLRLGDYPARISPKINAPKSWSSYDQYIAYDLLMPDGKVRTYYVIGMGTPTSPGASGSP